MPALCCNAKGTSLRPPVLVRAASLLKNIFFFVNCCPFCSFQTVFVRKNKAPKNPLSSFRWRGFRLEEYLIGQPLGKGCSAAVYEAAIPSPPDGQGSAQSSRLAGEGQQDRTAGEQPAAKPQQEEAFPLAIKMMWNISVRSRFLISSPVTWGKRFNA